MTSMPASAWFFTTSATALRTRLPSAAPSTGTPLSLAYIIWMRSSGRGRLPVCVVTKRAKTRTSAMASPTPIKTATRIVRPEGGTARQISADICVVGAGSAGISAALEAARLGRKVVLVDGLHALGGQAVNAVIGTFCGFFSNGYSVPQTVHVIAYGILRDLVSQEPLHHRHGA